MQNSETLKKVGTDLEPEDKDLRESIEEIHRYQQLLIEKKQKIEARAWDLKFQKYWGMIVAADTNFDESVKYSEYLIDHIGKFRRTATFYTHLIVNEMHKPLEKRLLRPLAKLDKITRRFCSEEPNPMVYMLNNLILKVCPKSGPIPKLYGKEFLSLDIMFDVLFILSKPRSDYNIRIPLSCLVDYKGFRAIVYGLIPLNEDTEPVLGMGEDGVYHSANAQGLLKQIPFIKDVLNLAEHTFLYKGTVEPVKVPLSPLIEMHKRNNIKKAPEEEEEEGEGFGCWEKRKEMDFHIYELDYDEDVYYLLKTSEIFPADCIASGQIGNFRPEFVCRLDKALRADTLKERVQMLSQFVEYEGTTEGLQDLLEAKQKLLNEVVPRVVEQLDSLNVVPIDSATLTQVFHSEGLNMRYLGLVAETSVLTQVKDLCVTEMLARTLKNILHEELSDKIIQFSQSPTKSYELLAKKVNYSARSEYCKRYKGTGDNYVLVSMPEKEKYDTLLDDPMHGYLLECVYDFLNMTFGKDHDTDEFWDRIVFPAAAEAFSYSLSHFQRSKVNLNAVFFAFVYHFGIELEHEAKFELGKTEKPFAKQVKDVLGKSKVYSLRNIPYKKLSEKYKEYRSEKKNELALKALKMKMSITRYLDDKTDTVALAEIAEILLEEGLVDKAIEKALEGVQLLNPLHAETVRFFCILMRAYYHKDQIPEADKYCFKAISALDFHWSVFHTLHTTVYTILAYLITQYKESYEDVHNLYKACLVSCTRVLGPNHLHTADVYMDIGRLWLKMGNKGQALDNIEKAYLIYEASIETSIEKNYALLANAALLLGGIIESQRRYKEALVYARKAAELYERLYAKTNETYIESMWLVISICYAMGMDELVVKNCKKLLEGIKGEETSMEKMKANYVAAAILVTTRNFSKETKRKLLKMAEEIYGEENNEQDTKTGGFGKLTETSSKIISLSALEFDGESLDFLNQLYEEAKLLGIFAYYNNLVESLCTLYAKTVDSEDNEVSTQGLSEQSHEQFLFPKDVAYYNNRREVYKKILKVFDKRNFYYLLIAQLLFLYQSHINNCHRYLPHFIKLPIRVLINISDILWSINKVAVNSSKLYELRTSSRASLQIPLGEQHFVSQQLSRSQPSFK
eukprot:TRINITY_DN1454_c0_g2_i1.p1 TRINITY_DN1454_c0_g2~~TRINITY_DN1454_c0_g2_i1.p1  ORF type:complete len:1135 (-),score=143.33 TRINITY_DN1454_c0_g2_i1:10055-13459(-)